VRISITPWPEKNITASSLILSEAPLAKENYIVALNSYIKDSIINNYTHTHSPIPGHRDRSATGMCTSAHDSHRQKNINCYLIDTYICKGRILRARCRSALTHLKSSSFHFPKNPAKPCLAKLCQAAYAMAHEMKWPRRFSRYTSYNCMQRRAN
jgi:hypothetical protein